MRGRLAILLAVAGLGTAAGAAAAATPGAPLTLSSAFADPLVDQEWWLDAVGAGSLLPPGPGKPVTIVDSGIDVSHPEFAGRPGLEVLNRQTVTGEEEDHGTLVSSVVGAPANGVGVVGIYPQALLRVWDASPSRFGIEDVPAIEGIDSAARAGAGVLNLSWSSVTDDLDLEGAIARAVRAGVLVVAAAGNQRQRGNPVVFPASSPHVFTVGATDEHGNVTFFSSSSPGMDVVAPGLDIPVADPFAAGGFTSADGTSFSAPIVAGAAAWLWTARPDLDASQVAELLRRTATDIGRPGWDQDSGYGLLNLQAALTAPAPPPDPQEPNDDIAFVRAKGIFAAPTPLVTSPQQPQATLVGRLAASDDASDVYRLWLPPRARLQATVQASDGRTLSVSLWKAGTLSIHETGARRRRDLLASGSGSAVVAGGAKGSVVYVSLAAARGERTDYTLSVTTSAAP